MKKCLRCGKTKPLADYYTDGRGVFSARCKSCHGVAQRTCVKCGSIFDGKANVKLCSQRCKQLYRPQTFKACRNCGRLFGPVDHRSRLYCSRSCHYAYRRKQPKLAPLQPTRAARNANAMVSRAVKKGTLIPSSVCQDCGRGDRRIQAAHYDYAEPLRVKWLCRSCHTTWDRLEPKGGFIPREITARTFAEVFAERVPAA